MPINQPTNQMMFIELLQVLHSIEELHVFLGRHCLPAELGGLLQYEHDAWIHQCKVCTRCDPPFAVI